IAWSYEIPQDQAHQWPHEHEYPKQFLLVRNGALENINNGPRYLRRVSGDRRDRCIRSPSFWVSLLNTQCTVPGARYSKLGFADRCFAFHATTVLTLLRPVVHSVSGRSRTSLNGKLETPISRPESRTK